MIFQHLNRADLRQRNVQALLVDCLSAGIDDENQVIAAMCDHQIVNDAAIRVCKKRVTLPPSRKSNYIGRYQARDPCALDEFKKIDRSMPIVAETEQIGDR